MLINIRCSVIVLLFLMLASFNGKAATGMEAAYAAYEKRDYATALKILMPLADSGDSVAQFNIANFYRNGWGVPQNFSEAFKWYRRAALLKYPPAQNSLGTMYKNGIGVTKNYSEAYKWYEESAKAGNIAAKFNLARMIQSGLGVEVDLNHAIHLYEQLLHQKSFSSEDQEIKEDAIEQLSILKKIPRDEIQKSLPKGALEFAGGNKEKQKVIIVEKERVITVNSPAAIAASVNNEPSIAFKTMNVYALVIGNANYQSIGKLKNPVNDAKLIAQKLREFNFKVTEVNNVTRNSLDIELEKFSKSAKQAGADLIIFYYAGHATQIDGLNYILPIDMDFSAPELIPLKAVRINDLIDYYLPGKTRLIFLDSCRDNPFSNSRTRGGSRGLASIQSTKGTLIAYAAKEGHVAYDGNESNSPFTKALANRIGDSSDISVVLRKVRLEVLEATQGKQEPWDYNSLTGEELILSRIKQSSY